jgi:hypothetical protein
MQLLPFARNILISPTFPIYYATVTVCSKYSHFANFSNLLCNCYRLLEIFSFRQLFLSTMQLLPFARNILISATFPIYNATVTVCSKYSHFVNFFYLQCNCYRLLVIFSPTTTFLIYTSRRWTPFEGALPYPLSGSIRKKSFFDTHPHL